MTSSLAICCIRYPNVHLRRRKEQVFDVGSGAGERQQYAAKSMVLRSEPVN